MSSKLYFSICLFLADKVISLCNYWSVNPALDFVAFSHKRPPPVSNQFVLHQNWSVTRELIIVSFSFTGKLSITYPFTSLQQPINSLLAQLDKAATQQYKNNLMSKFNYMAAQNTLNIGNSGSHWPLIFQGSEMIKNLLKSLFLWLQ